MGLISSDGTSQVQRQVADEAVKRECEAHGKIREIIKATDG
jgi:hypothetical protein